MNRYVNLQFVNSFHKAELKVKWNCREKGKTSEMTKMELESFAKDPRTELLSGEESLHHITVLKLNRNVQKAKN